MTHQCKDEDPCHCDEIGLVRDGRHLMNWQERRLREIWAEYCAIRRMLDDVRSVAPLPFVPFGISERE
jgi:hypothetical protein